MEKDGGSDDEVDHGYLLFIDLYVGLTTVSNAFPDLDVSSI